MQIQSDSNVQSESLMSQWGKFSVDNIWNIIVSHQGETFYTAKKLPFTYTVKGGELFTNRRERSITRSTFEKAYLKILSDPEKITGPKKLNVYGGPYVWAILKGIVEC